MNALDHAPGRHVSGVMTGVVVGYVRSSRGEDAVRTLLELAGETRPAEVLEDESTWSSIDEARRLFEAAERVTADPDVARRVGAHVLDQHAGTAVAAILRSLGSTQELLRNVAITAAKHSAVTSMEVVDLEDGRATVAAVTRAGITRDPRFCLYTAGVLSQASAMFGHPPADVVESQCQARGDGRCLYEVRWTTEDVEMDPAHRIQHLEREVAGQRARLEALQATATAFVTASSADEVLATITRRAGIAVRAPRFLLAVQLPSEPRLLVHHEGFESDDEARTVARSILSGAAAGRPTHCASTSSRRATGSACWRQSIPRRPRSSRRNEGCSRRTPPTRRRRSKSPRPSTMRGDRTRRRVPFCSSAARSHGSRRWTASSSASPRRCRRSSTATRARCCCGTTSVR